jgi:4-amino-4-deoxy-L-arabinose transferase-like glycosyltransferase
VLLAGSVLAVGLARERRAVVRELPAILLLGATGIAFLPFPPPLRTVAVGVAGIAFVAHLVLGRSNDGEADHGTTRTSLLCLALALSIAAAFLFYDLGDYAGSCLVWETGTVQGLGNAFHSGVPASLFARRQLLWSSGLLSTGDASLLYGAPTYAVMKAFGFSTWNLRVVAAVCALLSVVVAFVLARRFFGNVAAAATALALTSSVSFAYHGRYGVAMSATFLAVLVALLSVWLFLDRERHAWWMGAVAGAALYLATLQYATGRVVAILLLVFAVAFSILRRERFHGRRLCGLAALCLVVALVWEAQERNGASHALLEVRGEQFLVFAANPHTYRAEYGRVQDTVTWSDEIEMLRTTVGRTAPQFLALLAPPPAPLEPQAAMTSNGREVRPYYAPLIVFLLLGLAYSLRRVTMWPHACLLACAAGTSAALLLTSGVDAHRIAILTVACAIWIGLGLREAFAIATRLAFPAAVLRVLTLVLIASFALHLADQLYYGQIPRPTKGRVVLAEVESIAGPVVLAPILEAPETAWVYLQMLERQRRNPNRSGEILDPRLLNSIRETARPPAENILNEVTALADRATLILAPADEFRTSANTLRERGLEVTEHGTQLLRVLRIERGRPRPYR